MDTDNQSHCLSEAIKYLSLGLKRIQANIAYTLFCYDHKIIKGDHESRPFSNLPIRITREKIKKNI